MRATFFALAIPALGPVWAQVELAPHIQDHMVVQRGSRWEVSGTADEGRRFKVGFLGQEVEVYTQGGKWSAVFDVPALSAGPAVLSADGGRIARQVLVGDVWVCSGQSNMALTVDRASDGESIAQQVLGKPISIYQVPKPIKAHQPHAGRWGMAAPGRAGKFSAVCLAFGASLAERVKVPLGLIDASLGGTWIESWISASSLGRLPAAMSSRSRFERAARAREASGRRSNTAGLEKPSQLFDLMISPLGTQSIKGVLWYQGEGNRQNAGSYAELLSTLIGDWRSHWRNSALPFVVVQLPGFGTSAAEFDTRSAWAAVQEAQRVGVAASQPAALVVTLDLGDGTLHPAAKLPFGRRAAESAYRLAYQEGLADASPVPTKAGIDGKHAGLAPAGTSAATAFVVAREQSLEMADVTTHEIASGNVVLGISELGGGYINKLFIPGVGDVLAAHAARYGRGGQAAIRDELHGGRYNPTQAGFTDTAGTHCVIEQPSKGVLRIPPCPVSLWNGDHKYDFTEWENLAPDPYKHDKGKLDEDGIDESHLPGKQAAEITSEFDFTGAYRDVRDGKKIVIPAFQIQYEFRFVRQPGHAISQFRRATSAYNPSAEVEDRSVYAPQGKHPSAEDSLTGVVLSSTLRGDKSVWDPSVVFSLDKAGKLAVTSPARGIRNAFIANSKPVAYPLVIYSTSKDPNAGPAIGYYHPDSHVNRFSTVGRSVKDDSVVYEDERAYAGVMLGSLARTEGMWLFGARTEHTGLLSRRETLKGVYEAIRGGAYILVGTPNEIIEAARAIQD